MKKRRNLFGLALALCLSLVTISNVSADETACKNVTTEDGLKTALTTEDCSTITLGGDIKLKAPIEITKTVTIDGKGETKNYTISADTDFQLSGSNGTLLTAKQAGAKVTLTNLILSGAPKYGAQAFDGGELTLAGVKIENCKFGGVLVNAGTVTVKDLELGFNGDGKNNGIEISKGSTASDENDPKLVMDGTLNSTEETGVVNVASNDEKLDEFTVQNTENTENKLYVEEDGIVVTDEIGTVVYEGNGVLKETITGTQLASNGETAPTTHKVTITYDGNTVSFVVNDKDSLTDAADILAEVKNGVEDKKFTKFITSAGKDYDETAEITTDLQLIALYEEVVAESTVPETTPETTPETNPETLDNITVYLATGIIAITGVTGLGYLVKKKMEN